MLLSFAIGAAFSGASFYAYYDARLSANEETVSRFVEGFDRQFTDASSALDDIRTGAIDDIRVELEPLGEYVENATGIVELPALVGPSVWRLETRDEDGRPVTGSAFAVAPHQGGTAFVTSLSLVLASTTSPSPDIELVKGTDRVAVQLWTWDAERDLAIVVADRVVPALPLASDDRVRAATGHALFALSGVGGRDATAAPGQLLDRSEVGVQHTAPIGQLFIGGPLLTGSGEVVGVATAAYEPYGVSGGPVWSAPDVSGLCAAVLDCPGPDGGPITVSGGTADGGPDGEG